MKKVIPIALAAVVFISAAYAQGQCMMQSQHKEEMCCPQMKEMHGGMQLEMLDLSAEQKEDMKALKTETQKKIIPIKADIELKQIDLHNEMSADNPNRDKIMKITKEISDLELKIKQTKIDQKLKVHALLTPEQREQMKKMHHGKEMMQKRVIIKKEID